MLTKSSKLKQLISDLRKEHRPTIDMWPAHIRWLKTEKPIGSGHRLHFCQQRYQLMPPNVVTEGLRVSACGHPGSIRPSIDICTLLLPLNTLRTPHYWQRSRCLQFPFFWAQTATPSLNLATATFSCFLSVSESCAELFCFFSLHKCSPCTAQWSAGADCLRHFLLSLGPHEQCTLASCLARVFYQAGGGRDLLGFAGG